MVLLQRKLYFSKPDPEGGQHFLKGPASSRGIQMLISIEPHITCDFPAGGGGPDPIYPSGSEHEQRGSKTDRNMSLNMGTD